jgi:ABC-type amino acid transport substrate-binding protein
MTRSRTIRKAFLTLGLSLSAFTALGVAPAAAGPVADRVNSSGTLRVCIWPNYYGITFRDARNQQLRGVDIDLSAEFAKRLGARLQYVESSFAKLVDDVAAERCDVAMFGVGVTAQRQRSLAFSQPYLRSDVYGITTRANRVVGTWDDIDKPGVRVAVAAGTFMEPVMAQALEKATLVVVRAPQTREAELEAGRVDVFMTDYPYSRRLLENADWVRMVAPSRPFHPIPYAYAVKPGDDEWLRRVDEFVAEIKRDGTLEAAARRHGLSEIVVR